MELVAIIQALRRRRRLAAGGLILAVLATIGIGKAPVVTSADASTELLSDTHKSALIYPAPPGVETTPWRGQIETDLMLTAPQTERIANGARLPADQIAVFDPSLAAPLTAASLPRHASLAGNGALAGAPYQLALSIDPQFPIIHIEATAPDRDAATRLVNSASSIIQRDSSSLENKDIQGVSFTPVAALKVREIRSGGGRLMAIGVGVMLLVLWLGVVALVEIVLERRRTSPRKISAFADVDFV